MADVVRYVSLQQECRTTSLTHVTCCVLLAVKQPRQNQCSKHAELHMVGPPQLPFIITVLPCSLPPKAQPRYAAARVFEAGAPPAH